MKTPLKYALTALTIAFSCFACNSDANDTKENTVHATKGTIMQIVKIKSELSEAEFIKKAKEREPIYKANPGIVQKYYIKMDEPNTYGGVYIWDSAESLQKFKTSKMAASIPEAYKVIGKPDIEIVDILFPLREE